MQKDKATDTVFQDSVSNRIREVKEVVGDKARIIFPSFRAERSATEKFIYTDLSISRRFT